MKLLKCLIPLSSYELHFKIFFDLVDCTAHHKRTLSFAVVELLRGKRNPTVTPKTLRGCWSFANVRVPLEITLPYPEY